MNPRSRTSSEIPAGTGTTPPNQELDSAGAELAAQLDALAAQPDAWPELDPAMLGFLLVRECLRYAFAPSVEGIHHLGRLYSTVAQRMPEDLRRGTLDMLEELLERDQRASGAHGQAGLTNGLLPFLYEDPEPRIACVAATYMTVLMPRTDTDPLAGPRFVRRLAQNAHDESRRAALLAGLLASGRAGECGGEAGAQSPELPGGMRLTVEGSSRSDGGWSTVPNDDPRGSTIRSRRGSDRGSPASGPDCHDDTREASRVA